MAGKELDQTEDMEESDSETVCESNKVSGREKHANNSSKKSHLIQIQASNDEIDRRIAALIERKQREVDENNCLEFCGVHPSLEPVDGGCARTTAVFVPRAGGKSHIKVSRVVNMYGPQTRALNAVDNTGFSKDIKQENSLMEGIEERIANMEQHLKIAGSSKTDVFGRLKNLEQRILFLESLSPEYFTTGPPAPKRKRRETNSCQTASSYDQDMSLAEIDSQIQLLRDSLLKRSADS